MILTAIIILLASIVQFVLVQLGATASTTCQVAASVVLDQLADPATLHFELVTTRAAHIHAIVVDAKLQVELRLFFLLLKVAFLQ